MKLAGFLLLPAGWLIAVSAVVLFPATPSRWVFVLAGLCLEALGVALSCRSWRGSRERSEDPFR
jgi:cytochrome c biogenesis factor